MQLIICYESRPSADTDYAYVHEYIRYFYKQYERKFKIDKVSFRGKSNYNKVERNIKDKINKYKYTHKNEKQFVVYCLDTDYGINESSECNEEIIKYCESKKYYLIWFHRDVEEVFLKRRVKDSEKTQTSKMFLDKNLIENVDANNLTVVNIESKHFQTSNIKEVLDTVFRENFNGK